MTQTKKLILVLLAGCFCSAIIQAQNAISSSGGNASGSGGSVSYTVGQIVYTSISGIGGSVAHGVQQPYEISVPTELEEGRDITLIFSVYPNPTSDFITLKVGDYEKRNLSYWLYGISGNIIETKKVLSFDTQINMGKQVTGIYFLKIIDNSKEIKTFKIIKH
jgi:hypothetical protein